MNANVIDGVRLSRPFIVLEPEGRGGPAVAAAVTITGNTVVQVIPQDQERQELVVRCPRVTWSERGELEEAMTRGRPFEIYSGNRRWLVLWQDKAAQKWTPAIAFFPDVDWNGAPMDEAPRECSAELKFWIVG